MTTGRGMVRGGSALALGFVAACGNEVNIVSPSGTGSGGEGAATSVVASSSTGAGPRVIPITLESGPEYLADGIVFQSHVDGSLVASWSPSELPVMATVVDGDLITFAHVDEDSTLHSFFASRRITPVVDEVHGAFPGAEATQPGCVLGPPTHVIIHVPGVPGADVVRVSSARFGSASSYLPIDLEIDVAVCPGEKISLLAMAQSESDNATMGSQFWEAIDPVPNGTIELTPTFEGAPRKKLPVEVSGIDAGGSVWATAHWTGTLELAPAMYGNEHHEQVVEGVPSFLYAPDVLDLPRGFQVLVMSSERPKPEGACRATSSVLRFGGTDVPIQYDVSGLGQPSWDGTSWKVGPGTLGDWVGLAFDEDGWARWSLREDPHFAAFPVVLPTLPPLPPKLHAPSASVPLESISHWTESGKQVSDPGVQWMTIGQRVGYTDCP